MDRAVNELNRGRTSPGVCTQPRTTRMCPVAGGGRTMDILIRLLAPRANFNFGFLRVPSEELDEHYKWVPTWG